jgi:hypothetical protein
MSVSGSKKKTIGMACVLLVACTAVTFYTHWQARIVLAWTPSTGNQNVTLPPMSAAPPAAPAKEAATLAKNQQPAKPRMPGSAGGAPVVSPGSDLTAKNLEVKDNYPSLFFEIFKEMLILGLLVFVWEYLHERHKQNNKEQSQIDSIIELLFLIDQRKEPKTPSSDLRPPAKTLDPRLKSKFFAEVCDIYDDLGAGRENFKRIHEHNRQFSEADLSTFANEELLYNVEETLTGIQDILIEGDEKNTELHGVILRIYKEVRLLLFLVKRYSLVQKLYYEKAKDPASIAALNLEKIKENNLNILIGVSYSLNRMHILSLCLHYLRDGNSSKIKPASLGVSRSVLSRIFSAIKYRENASQELEENFKEILGLFEGKKEFASLEEVYQAWQEGKFTPDQVLDPHLRVCLAYFMALRESKGTAFVDMETLLRQAG